MVSGCLLFALFALVVLLISDQGFDAVWSEKKLATMKKNWNVEIARIYPYRRATTNTSRPGGAS